MQPSHTYHPPTPPPSTTYHPPSTNTSTSTADTTSPTQPHHPPANSDPYDTTPNRHPKPTRSVHLLDQPQVDPLTDPHELRINVRADGDGTGTMTVANGRPLLPPGYPVDLRNPYRAVTELQRAGFPTEAGRLRDRMPAVWTELQAEPAEPFTLINPADAETEEEAEALLDGTGGISLYADPAAPTVIAGPPKAGKTSVIVAALAARPDMRTLILAGEGLRWIRRRVATWHPQPGNVRLATIPTDSQHDRARAAISEFSPHLVVLDPFVEAVALWSLEANSDTTPGIIVNRLHDLAGEVPIIIAAHNRKTGAGGPPLDQIREPAP